MTSGSWFDGDGLYRQYGTAKATSEVAGEYKTYGDMREINLRIPDLTAVGSTSAAGAGIISNNVKFPTGLRIARIDIISDVAATGSGAVLNLGLIGEDRTTEIDFDGLIAALPVTSFDTVGETTSLTVGSTYAGALLGTSTSSVGYLTADYDTAAFMAGALNIRIFLYGRGTITQ